MERDFKQQYLKTLGVRFANIIVCTFIWHH